MQPSEPAETHVYPAMFQVEPTKTEQLPASISVSDPSTTKQLNEAKGGHDAPRSPTVVSNADLEKGSVTRQVSARTLWEHIRVPTTAIEDEGRGYDDWLKLPKLELKDAPLTTCLHGMKQFLFVIVIAVPSVLLSYIFSLLVRAAVEEWQKESIAPLQKNPIIAGLIGEPFHNLSDGILFATFTALCILCPFWCCLTKMLIHPLYLFGRQVMPLWKPAVLMACIMSCWNLLAATIMSRTGVHLPRIVWMGMVFLGLFAGLFLCSRKAAQILGFKPFTFLYFRASFVANVLLYLYAVFFPFWFFGTESLAAKLVLAIGFHPTVEFGVAFLWQHTAVFLRYNDPATAIYPGFHYSCLFALYGAFLLVNFEEMWQNIVAFSLLRMWTILCKVFAQELTYFTYVTVVRLTPEEAAAILSTVRFKRYRNDVINSGAIIESTTIIIAGAVTFFFNFNKSTQDGTTSTTSFADTALLVVGQVVIGMVCDAVADIGLAYRGLPWHNAWQTKESTALYKFCHVVLVSVGMFLFYFYPFLASHMVIDD